MAPTVSACHAPTIDVHLPVDIYDAQRWPRVSVWVAQGDSAHRFQAGYGHHGLQVVSDGAGCSDVLLTLPADVARELEGPGMAWVRVRWEDRDGHAHDSPRSYFDAASIFEWR